MHPPAAPPKAPVERTLVPGSVVSGYRLVRRVTDAADTVMWLARAPGADQTVCVSVQRATEALDRRIAAHGRISSPHVLALVDLATDGDGRVILVTERTDWTLATLLASRAHLAPGEAVTILAPLTAGLAAIHDGGFTHDALSPLTVLFCADGRPVIGGLESMRGPPDANPAERDRRRAADHRSLSILITAVGLMVDEPARTGFSGVSEWIVEQLDNGADRRSLLAQVECKLFALASALPVVLVADRHPVAGSAAVARGSRRPVAFPSRRVGTPLPGLLRRAASALAVNGVPGFLARVLRGRALVVCLGIVLLVVTLIAGLSLIPDRREAAGAPATRQSSTPASATSQTAPAETGPDPPAGTDTTARGDDAITGDDAVAAALALLERRVRCADAASTTCVPAYAEAGSALAEADAHAFGGSAPAGLLLGGDGAASAVEHLQAYGDAVLLRAVPANEKRQPVLILAVRTDTGWRLRDLFEPD